MSRRPLRNSRKKPFSQGERLEAEQLPLALDAVRASRYRQAEFPWRILAAAQTGARQS